MPGERSDDDGRIVDGFRFAAGEAAERAASLRPILSDPRSHDAEIIKENRKRTVFRVESPIGGLVVKHHQVAERAIDVVKRWARGGPASAEWRVAGALQRAGIAAPERVAMAPRGVVPGVEVSAARLIPGATALGGFLEARYTCDDGRTDKRAWIGRAVDLLLALHAARFDHRDYHGGNILVEADGASGRLVVIDLHRVVVGAEVSRSRRVRALADLLHTLRFSTGPLERRLAVDRYAAAAGLAADTLAEDVERAIERREARRVRSRSLRAMRESSKFGAVARGGLRGYRRSDVALDALYDAVEQARVAIARGDSSVRSVAPRSSVAITEIASRRVVVKTYEGDGWRKRPVWPGRAGAAYARAHALWVRGIEVPPVVAWLRTPDRGYLVVDEVVAATPLSALSFRLLDDAAAQRAAARAVADLLAALFRQRVDVHDLSPKNILLVGTPSGYRASLCDFDGIRIGRPLSAARMIRGLAQVNDVAIEFGLRPRLRVLVELRRRLPALRGVGVASRVAAGTARRAAKRLADPASGSLVAVEPR